MKLLLVTANIKNKKMLKHLRAKCLVMLGLTLLLSPILPRYAADAADESPSQHKLPPISIPTVPVDDNPFQREVFSLKELKDGADYLFERIIETRMDFPLMFDPHGKFSRALFQNPNRARFGKDFSIIFILSKTLLQSGQ